MSDSDQLAVSYMDIGILSYHNNPLDQRRRLFRVQDPDILRNLKGLKIVLITKAI
jgi:hypothetical protein